MELAEGPQRSHAEASTRSPLLNEIVGPGDIVLDLTGAGRVVRLGGGLRQDGDCVVAMRAGRLRHTKPNKYWVEGSQKRYVPNSEDGVIGLITDSKYEAFSVDIGAPTSASLPKLAFEGATRRNAPNLQIGAAVYARVVKSHRDINPELSCMDASDRAAGFGHLKGGYIFDCTGSLARALLSKPTCPVLEALSKSVSFEIAVGLNGRVWVNADSPATVIAVSNAISSAEFLSPAQQQIMVKKILGHAKA